MLLKCAGTGGTGFFGSAGTSKGFSVEPIKMATVLRSVTVKKTAWSWSMTHWMNLLVSYAPWCHDLQIHIWCFSQIHSNPPSKIHPVAWPSWPLFPWELNLVPTKHPYLHVAGSAEGSHTGAECCNGVELNSHGFEVIFTVARRSVAMKRLQPLLVDVKPVDGAHPTRLKDLRVKIWPWCSYASVNQISFAVKGSTCSDYA